MTADRHLPRVDLEYLRPLLNRIAPDDAIPPVVSEPEQGWHELRDRLHVDLRVQGAILMQQVRTVLLGLRQLPMLTVGAYRRAGELGGVEALVIARAIRRAGETASNGEVGAAAARSLLSALVLPGGPNQPPKTQRVAFGSLVEVVGNRSEATGMLLAFQADDVVRPAEGIAGESAWQLDHDYLARAVLAEARQANRLSFALREGQERFDRVKGHWGQMWRALLPVSVQARLAWEWVRGRLRYGGAVGYVGLSLLKPGLALLLICIGSGGAYVWNENRILDAHVRGLFDRFIGANGTSAVLETWHAPRAVRRRLFSFIQTDENRLAGAARTGWPEAHGGLEAQSLKEAAHLLCERLDQQTFLSHSVLTNIVARMADQSAIKEEADALRERLERAASTDSLRRLAQAYATMAAKLTDQTAIKQAAKVLRERLARETENAVVPILEEAYVRVAANLSDEAAIKHEAEELLQRLESETDSNILRYRAAAFATVGAKLVDQTDNKQAAIVLRKRLTSETNVTIARNLAVAYSAVVENLTEQPAIKQDAEALRWRLTRETNSELAQPLMWGYVSAVAKLTDQSAIQLEVEALREQLVRETNIDLAGHLAQAYAAVAKNLSEQSAVVSAVEALRERLAHAASSDIAGNLAKDYASVAAKLSDQSAMQQAAEVLRDRLMRDSGGQSTFSFSQAYAKVGANLYDQSAVKQETRALRERLVRETDLNLFGSLAYAYGMVAANLSDQPAVKQEAEMLRERLMHETGSNMLRSLASAYAKVAANLSDQSAIKHEADTLRERLGHESNSDIGSVLAVAYASMAAKRDDQYGIDQAAEMLSNLLERETDSETASRLADAYAKVALQQVKVELRQQNKPALERRVRNILIVVGHPYLRDNKSLLATLESVAGKSFGTNAGAAVEWWVKEFNGDPATLRPLQAAPKKPAIAAI